MEVDDEDDEMEVDIASFGCFLHEFIGVILERTKPLPKRFTKTFLKHFDCPLGSLPLRRGPCVDLLLSTIHPLSHALCFFFIPSFLSLT